MIRLTTILTAIVLTACAVEEPKPEVSLEPWMLASGTTLFASMGVGFSGQPTPELARVWELRDADDAEKHYLDYLASDDPGIRLYGLLGLQMIDSPEYPAQLERLLQDDSPVNIGAGCIISVGITSKIAQRLDLERDTYSRIRFGGD